MLRRSDKRKDRVEISPEQLTNAAIQADKLTHELGQPMRVLGWYHSHPHITVWPSHVGKNLFSRTLLIIIYVFCGAMKKARFCDIQFSCIKIISVFSRYIILVIVQIIVWFPH
jgi:proteasome lid subunit RPN8/RPN11